MKSLDLKKLASCLMQDILEIVGIAKITPSAYQEVKIEILNMLEFVYERGLMTNDDD